MEFSLAGLAVTATRPRESADFLVRHLGFAIGVDLGWYVNTQHPAHPNLSVDFVARDHESWPDAIRGREVAGTMLAFLVADVDAEHARLVSEGVTVVKPLVTEAWGQRRFQIAAPEGLVVELLQAVAPDPAWVAANLPG
jgi:catechol 2,3-dioxygenase-like lactoylglutathione lyase family enzyme